MAGATTCPRCGARVSAFAAGCAACGEDLEAHARRARIAAENRAPAAPRRGPRLPHIPIPRPALSGWTWAYLAVTAFFVVYVPVLGALLGAIGVMHGVFEGLPRWIALCGLLTAVGVALALAPVL